MNDICGVKFTRRLRDDNLRGHQSPALKRRAKFTATLRVETDLVPWQLPVSMSPPVSRFAPPSIPGPRLAHRRRD